MVTQKLDEPRSYGLKLRFSGKTVDEKGLDLYDGARSFEGFAQALQIVVHAYLSNEVVSRSTALRGAKLYFGSPKRGSVLFDIVALIEQYPATAGISAVVFYDFVKYSFARATGLFEKKPETKAVQKLAVDEEFFDRLSFVLEGSLQRGHRAIDNGVKKITLERPRSTLLTFDLETSRWVHTREEDPDIVEFHGHVTRYNSITGNGRAYIRELDKVVPFRPSEHFSQAKCSHLSWSLHGSTTYTKKELIFKASTIISAGDAIKRLILEDCSMA
tara:strand:+ start:37960 stop:38778 length:819 start_codon:yes stop_codon:yes gene_type:complete